VVRSGPGLATTTHELRAHLLQRLPDYMVPSGFVFVDALPRTTSGKIDHRSLPPPDVGEQSSYVAPRTATEELLVEIWCDVLGLKQVSVHDNFFELGGHSLLATQVISRVHDSLGVELSMRQFFVAPTVAQMGPAIEAELINQIKAATDDEGTTEPAVAAARE
jgi:acyl carrier protein